MLIVLTTDNYYYSLKYLEWAIIGLFMIFDVEKIQIKFYW